MFTTSKPLEVNHLDSARVEKRGPCTTTTVPPLRTGTPTASALAARTSLRSAQ
jgi:hypothetical protein